MERARSAALGGLAMIGALYPLPISSASAQGTEAELEALRLRAEDVFKSTTPDADGNASILAAWKQLEDAARGADPDHRLIGYAQIKQASSLYQLGRNDDALAVVKAGLAALPDGDPLMLLVRGEGVALLGTILAQGGKAEAAIAALRGGYTDFVGAYDALPEEERTRAAAVAKSNLEFSLSQVLLRLSEIDEALAFQRASLETRETALGPNDPDTVASYYGLAGALRRAGRMEEAEAQARIAVARAVDHVDPSHPSYARALEMLAIVLSRSGQPIEASDYLARALDLKRTHEGPDSLFFGYGIHQLGTIFHQRERYRDAVPLFAEAHLIFAKYQGEDSPFGLGSLAYAGQGEFALGRTDAAVERLSALYARLGDASRDLEIIKRIGPDLARGLKRMGRNGEARAVAASIIARQLDADGGDVFGLRHMQLVAAWVQDSEPAALQAQARAMLDYLRRQGVTDLAGFLQSEQRAALDLVMEIAVATDDPDLMVSAMSLASASALSRATQLRRARDLEGDEGLQAAIRALQNAQSAADKADRDVLTALARGTDAKGARAALAKARRGREDALARLARDFPDWQADALEDDSTIASVRAGLGRDEALLAIIPAYDGAYRLLLTASALHMERIPIPRARLVDLARTVRESAITGRVDEQAAHTLGRAFLPESALAALGTTRVLKVLAGGPFASLPLPLLQVEKGGWLIDHLALANVSSLEALAADGGERAGNAAARFVAFAAPTPFSAVRDARSDREDGQPSDGQPSDRQAGVGQQRYGRGLAAFFTRESGARDALASLGALPGAAREAQAMAQSFAPEARTIFIGEEAGEAKLDDERIARADVLLFATHGLVAGEVEGIAEPALVLAPSPGKGGADGLLTASEIAALELSADWIILTACDSAAGFAGGLPAFSGLAQAFRFAGGGSLLATHWRVRDDVAAFIAAETVRHYRANGNKAEALRHAVRALRETSGIKGAERPELWAPFVLVE